MRPLDARASREGPLEDAGDACERRLVRLDESKVREPDALRAGNAERADGGEPATRRLALARARVERIGAPLRERRADVRSRAAQRRHHERRDAGAEEISRHESPKAGEQDDRPHGGDGE